MDEHPQERASARGGMEGGHTTQKGCGLAGGMEGHTTQEGCEMGRGGREGGMITGVVRADARPDRGDGAAAVDGVDAVAAAVRRVPLARAACGA